MLKLKEVKHLKELLLDLGKEVEDIKNKKVNYVNKEDGSPISEADSLVNSQLNNFTLSTDFKNVISEENNEIPYNIRKKWDYFWIIDPIDGTKEYINKGIDYTINIALCKKKFPIFSVVYAPAIEEFYLAKLNEGVLLNNKKIKNKKTKNIKSIKAYVSKSHMNKETEKFIQKLALKYDVTTECMGSSLKICKIAKGDAHIYPRLSSTMEWDVCAAHLVLHESGGFIKNMHSNDITYNNKSLVFGPYIASSNLNFEKELNVIKN